MWNVKSIGSYGYYAYDAAMVLLKAIKKAGTTKTDAVVKVLRGTNWKGMVTGDVQFDQKGDRKLAHIIWIVKNGKFVPYWNPLTKKYF
jgi:branched-chain amino acid transport system substrate-binding protein